ncbi:MAG: hypothetical protein R3C03_17560 [Pirellulaceae bacterium]
MSTLVRVCIISASCFVLSVVVVGCSPSSDSSAPVTVNSDQNIASPISETPISETPVSETPAPVSGFQVNPDSVTSISVSIVNHPEPNGNDIAEFTVSPDFHDKLLAYVNGAPEFRIQIDPKLRGMMTIITDDGQINLTLFCPTQSDELLFSQGGGWKYKGKSWREFVRTVEGATSQATTR